MTSSPCPGASQRRGDAVTSISAPHHMDLPAVLPRLAAALRSGGLLIAVSHHRLEIPRGLPAGRRYRRELYQRQEAQPLMPIKNPQLSLRQVRAQAAAALPGCRVRWLVQWRYELTWRKRGLPAAIVLPVVLNAGEQGQEALLTKRPRAGRGAFAW